MSDYASNYNSMEQVNTIPNRKFKVSVIAHYDDEKNELAALSTDYIFDYKKELGTDFADHAVEIVQGK